MSGNKPRQSFILLALVLSLILGACTPRATNPNQVEVFSWWIGGGEAAGLDAMIALYKEQHPEIEFINAAVTGGAGTNARALLATRLQAGNAPDSWLGHAGQELIGTYVKAKQIEPLNDLYEQEGWLDVMPKSLIPLISQDGKLYSVPVNIHRANMLWYNPKILKENAIDVPKTLDEWLAAMDQLKAKGITPLALGEQWTAMHLFETILLSALGPAEYNGLWAGTMDWNSPDVTRALEYFAKAMTYTNTDASSLTWQDASQLVVNGDAAFNVMGDWVEGYYKGLKMEPHRDFGWTPVPGSEGMFQFLSDSFVLPVNAPHRTAAVEWLKLCGSKEGQDVFNPLKGSIPVRKDADRSLYDEYLQSAMDDWATNTVVGSLTHGVVANDSWKTEINTALGLFLTNRDVQTFQKALVAACKSSGPCE